MSKSRSRPVAPRRPAGSWRARSGPRRAARPRTGTPARATASAATTRADEHRQRPGDEGEHQPGRRPRARRSPSVIRPGREQQPEHHEQPDLGQPGDPLGEGPGGGAVRQLACCRAPARRRRPRRSRSACRAAAAPYARTARRQHGERVEAGRRQRHPAHQPGAAEADTPARTPRRRPARRRRCRRCRAAPWSCTAPVETRVTSTTVGASLSPDSASRAPVEPARQRHHAQHREHRGRVGRAR